MSLRKLIAEMAFLVGLGLAILVGLAINAEAWSGILP